MTKFIRILLYVFISLSFISIGLLTFAYFSVFGGPYSDNINDWGFSGSFFGGIIGTLLTFVTTLLLIYSSYQQHKEIEFEKVQGTFFKLFNYRQDKLTSIIETTQIIEWFDLATRYLDQQSKIEYTGERKINHINNTYKNFNDNFYPQLRSIINSNLILIKLLEGTKNKNSLAELLKGDFSSSEIKVMIYLLEKDYFSEEEEKILKNYI